MTENDNAKFTRPRPVRESISEMTELVLPNDANPLNALLGGRHGEIAERDLPAGPVPHGVAD